MPVFADVKVGVERADASGNPWLTLEPLKRLITIEDCCATPPARCGTTAA
jgi:hypothetical protein